MKNLRYLFLLVAVLVGFSLKVYSQEAETVKNVLFIGDSMTGWMAERLQAYGIENGFEVSTVLWDGSTIAKWGTGNRISAQIEKYKPNAVFISLGMNELLEKFPEKRLDEYVNHIKKQLGDIPYLWIGPPSWPGKGKGEVLNKWLESKLPKGRYFCSSDLTLARQSKSNPHPSKEGIMIWMDKVAEYVDSSGIIAFKSLNKPSGIQMKRGNVFIYKRMKETL